MRVKGIVVCKGYIDWYDTAPRQWNPLESIYRFSWLWVVMQNVLRLLIGGNL